ncbi:MAG TPA: hypothetical protein VI485_13385 [Vicinamibacterales bacterium]|nr:hypothetical protein [Vicinamibacterales bacterium]
MTLQRFAGSCVLIGMFMTLMAHLTGQDRGVSVSPSSEPSVDVLHAIVESHAYQAFELGQAADVLHLAAQGRGGRTGGPADSATTDPMAGPVVRNAPYSADAVTTVTQALGDGTRIEQSVTARFYRDSEGRVRREQTIIGLAAQPQTTITISLLPDDGSAYMLDPATRTARRVPRLGALFVRTTGQGFSVREQFAFVASPSWVTPVSVGGDRATEESLGTKQIDGVKAIGRRTTSTIPVGQIGNDRAIEITDERWESPELRLLVRSRHHDPRSGDVEYQLTNINRAEPPADLFMVPPDYTFVGPQPVGAGGRGTPGTRTGGPGGR